MAKKQYKYRKKIRYNGYIIDVKSDDLDDFAEKIKKRKEEIDKNLVRSDISFNQWKYKYLETYKCDVSIETYENYENVLKHLDFPQPVGGGATLAMLYRIDIVKIAIFSLFPNKSTFVRDGVSMWFITILLVPCVYIDLLQHLQLCHKANLWHSYTFFGRLAIIYSNSNLYRYYQL